MYMSERIIYVNVNVLLDFPITHKNASVLCQSECTCLHKPVNMAAFFTKSNENTYSKGRALMQLYRGNHIQEPPDMKVHIHTEQP